MPHTSPRLTSQFGSARARGAAAAGGLEQLVTAAATEDCVLGVVIAARRGLHVLFDRFWLPGGAAASDTVRVQWLEVLHGVCAKELSAAAEGHVRVASYRGCAVVWKVAGGVVLFLTGCGLYDEIALAEAVNVLGSVLMMICKSKVVSEGLVLSHFGKITLAVDQLVFMGQLERVDAECVYKSIKMKSTVK